MFNKITRHTGRQEQTIKNRATGDPDKGVALDEKIENSSRLLETDKNQMEIPKLRNKLIEIKNSVDEVKVRLENVEE